jgi:hypothetical protein
MPTWFNSKTNILEETLALNFYKMLDFTETKKAALAAFFVCSI